jgi:chromosome segregation ATPase
MTAMPEPTAGEPDARFAREGKTPSQSPRPKPTRRKQNEALVDATQLLDRLADVTSEGERARVRLENERAKAASLEVALEREQGLRKRAEGALDQAKAASGELSSQLEAERAARKQAEVERARVDEKAATLEQQVNLTWSQLKVSEEEQQQGSQPRRWWRGEG